MHAPHNKINFFLDYILTFIMVKEVFSNLEKRKDREGENQDKKIKKHKDKKH